MMDATNPFEAGRQSGRSACGADLAEWKGYGTSGCCRGKLEAVIGDGRSKSGPRRESCDWSLVAALRGNRPWACPVLNLAWFSNPVPGEGPKQGMS